ncbi:MAG: magnesium transporter CorA family protein [Oscillospiraceae bacterium]|jgi:magnesium transporter|nr:magnesium transporter CorA family protein [Oscillospiraceae bacterium]
MINYYKTVDGRITSVAGAEKDCWIAVEAPTAQEIDYLVETLGVDAGFIRSALDEEETSHIDKEDDQTLIIVDTPVADKHADENSALYYTMPIGFVVFQDYIITISLRECPILGEISTGLVKHVNTAFKTNFLLTVLLRIAMRYVQYLRQIDKISYATEKQLHQSMRNKELIQLLSLEKSLVYFSTALKSTEVTLEKIYRGRIIKLYDEDEELLEDTLIEIKQAIETCNIYSGILSGTMDAFASIISNNLNIVMKVLTSITIVMAIPNIIFSFYGMNVADLPFPVTWVPLAMMVVLCGITALILYKKGYFS